MGHAPKARKPGPKKLPVVELPAELVLDLDAFRDAHYDASYSRVVREALRFFIDSQIKAQPETRRRFDKAKIRLGQPTSQPSVVRRVDFSDRKS